MQRRKFLGTVALGAGFTALPMWLSRAFGPRPDICPEDAPAAEPEVQVQRPACEPGTAPFKPLLILVIPADSAQQYRRGQAFGELINHGSDEQLAALACFEVRCLRIDQLEPQQREQLAEEPLMLVLDHSATPSLLPLTAPLAYVEDEPDRWGGRHDWEEIQRRQEADIDVRIATIAGLIAGAADGPRLAAQACRERQGLPHGDLQRLGELPQSLGELGPADLDRAPALGLLAARSGDIVQHEHLSTLLAASVRARLCDSPIPGAPWARTHGCGVTVEGDTRNSRVACGMGNVPDRSSRFLMFYTREY